MAASATRDSEKIGFPPFTVNNIEWKRESITSSYMSS
jgi:hypothetical protein